ncbi:MAG TPA: hypothetical protein VJY62_10875 [Bacteroidia bacterium]|nr:hypothetical protein [Bacteroidia bacterium]
MLKLIKTHLEDAVLYAVNKIKKTSLYVIIRTRFLPFFSLITVLSFHGCVKDDLDFKKLEQTNYSPELAVPLAYSSLSIEDLMKNESDSGILIIDENKFCTLVYSSQALQMRAADMISVPDQDFNQGIALNDSIATLVNQLGNITFGYSQDIDFSMIQGMQVDSMFFKGGNMKTNFKSGIPANITITLTIPALTLNGNPFSQSFQLNYTSSLPVTAIITSPLEHYKLDLTNGGVTYNQLKVNYTINIATTGTSIQGSDNIDIGLNFNNIRYSKLFGYFGQQTLMSPQDTINISLFNTQNGFGSFKIAEPEIRVDFVNSFGFPVRARIIQMTGMNGNLTNFVVANGIPDPLPINSPNIHQIGQELTGSFTMTNSNSNVQAMIANQPKYIISQTQNEINPNGNTGENFVVDTSKLSVNMEVKLPLYGTADNFILNDTVNFSVNNLQNIESLIIRTSLENGFPIDTKFQVYFTDENYSKLDSLVYGDRLLMPSASVNPVTGKVTASTIKSTDHTMDRGRILKIMTAKKLILQASLTSANNGATNVKIYADYKFKVNLGAIAKVNL